LLSSGDVFPNGSKISMKVSDTFAGQLNIDLKWRHGEVTAVAIQSNRLRLNPRLLINQPLKVAPRLTGMLFSACGMAQSITAARACEQAIAAPLEPQLARQQDFQVNVEMLFEHLLRLFQDWGNTLTGDTAAATELQLLFKLKRDLLKIDLKTENPKPILDAIRQCFENRLLGLRSKRWVQYCSSGDLKKLAIRGKIGNYITMIRANHWEHLGHHALNPLPVLDNTWWTHRLTSADADYFIARPEIDGCAVETSSLTRQWQEPALRYWRNTYGSGLLTRLMARVLDMLECWDALYPLALAMAKHPLPYPAPLHDAQPPPQTLSAGVCSVHTARGLLTHRVVQEAGMIRHYQIVAPTEWNFHPQGSLSQMLHGLQALDETELRQQAQALITALDPCVAYQLEISTDA
jgi:coenzyme F420-reducing hydrogenase alpha subunit